MIILACTGLVALTAVGTMAVMSLRKADEAMVFPVQTQSGALLPAVSAHTPSTNATGISPNAKITLIFNQPMVALTQVQGDAAATQWKGWPVTISPKLSGSWRWLSTYAAQFTPDRGLNPGTLYTVTVPAGIQTTSGQQTKEESGWRFETERTVLVSTDPTEGYSLAGPTTQITLTFNQEMNPESVAHHVKLLKTGKASADKNPSSGTMPVAGLSMSGSGSVPSGEEIAIKSIHFGSIIQNDSGDSSGGKKVTDKRSIVLVPEKPLSLDSSYTVFVSAGVLGAVGDLGSKENMTVHFSTVGPLTIVSSTFQYGGIALQFSSPLTSEVSMKEISLSPPLAKDEQLNYSTNLWEDNRQLMLNPTALEPSTDYTLTISKKFADDYGQHLAEPFTFKFTTPQVDPMVTLTDYKGDFGIFERGKPPVYYINDVNVSEVNVEFAKLTLKDFIDIRQQKLGGMSTPDLKGKESYKTLSIKTKATKNHWESVAFDIEKKFGVTLKPGIYAMILRAPEYKDYNGQPAALEQYFAVTNTALTLKYSGDKALIWATDLTTGEPVQGASVTLHALSGATPVQGKTDAQGFFESPVNLNDFKNQSYDWQPEFWITSQTNDDFAFVSSQWNGGYNQNGMSIWTDFHSPMSAPFRLHQEFITDRPVYRPGDTVSFKGVVRLKDWNGILQLPGEKRQMQITIQDPVGTEVFKMTLPFTEFGGFYGSFKTADTASIGSYGVQLQLLPESDVAGLSYAQGFSVLAYRKPEYKVEVTTDRDDYEDGDPVNADISGNYYFGAPLANADVTWSATLTDYFFNRFTDGWYSFSTEDSWCWWQCEPQSSFFTQGKGTLDATGHLSIRVPASINDKKVSQILTIEANVTDPNNQLVSNRVSVPVHKSRVYVGIRNEDYAVAPGETAKMSIVTVDPKGKPLANRTVSLSLSSRVWNTIKKKGVDGQFTFENESVDTFIKSQRVTTGTDGKATASVVPPAGGSYIITVDATDDNGHVATAGTSLYAWSSSYVNWPHENDNSIDVIADKPEYAVGDTAKLLVKSPFQGKGVKALVTVERENVMTKKVMDVTGNALPIEVPITEDLIPNVYVSVVIMKPRDGETFDDQGKDTGMPSFRIGYAQLHVETKRKNLSVSVETNKKQYLPGEKVTATIKAKDAFGKPVQGEFTLASVDMSVIALLGFHMPDLVANFYMDHGLGVNTAEMLTYLIERFKPGSKGGGGGEMSERKRGNFQDTAFWNPVVVTDAKGEATVSFTLPDNLTTWQLLAVGNTKEGQFGAGVKEILETKNVIIRPVRPRFAVRGDKITLGAIVHNFLDSDRTFTVSLRGAGFTATGKTEQNVTVKAGEQMKVEFPVVAGNVDGMTLTMKAETTGGVDEIEEKIPVYIFGTPQSVASTGQTDTLVTEKVLAPSAADASSGDLKVTVSPSMATYLPAGLEYLAEYPYGCAEQTASTFLPQVAIKKLQGFDAFKIVSDTVLDSNVGAGLQKLYGFQRPDGGFGYWQDSPESRPYLTAYILYSLRTAKSAGYSVDDYAMKRAADYLGNILHSASKDQTDLELSTRAYILFVLSETGKPDGNLLSNLYDQSSRLPVFAQAELAMALQKSGSADKTKTLLTHILDNAKIDPRGAHVEESKEDRYRELMQTNQRSTAEVLQAMIRLDPENVLIPQFIHYLLSSRKDGHWDTTQSTVQTILALVDYLKSTGELNAQYIAGVEVNDKMVLTQKFAKENILTRKEVTLALDQLQRGKENTVKIGIDGKGTLFYDLLLSYFYTGDTLPPAEQGISIMRELQSMDQKGPSNVTSVKVGDSYRVTLTMTVPEDRHFVAVESPLHAGLEGIDLQLQTSKQSGLPTDVVNQNSGSAWWWYDEDEDNGLWRFSHKEFRDDRVFLFADYLPAGVYKYTYLVRATTPGTFRLRPARIFEMYFPENFGQTDGGWFTVKE